MARSKTARGSKNVIAPKKSPEPHIADDELIATLKRFRGMVYLAAEALGITPAAIYRRSKRNPAIRDARRRQFGARLDAAELKLQQLIAQDNVAATIFFLKTQGKERGYVERREIVVSHEQERVLRKHGLSAGEALELFVRELASAETEKPDE